MQQLQVKRTINMATAPLGKARAYAIPKFREHNLELYEVLPNFDPNYQLTQDYLQKFSLDIPRKSMPVIEPRDMAEFEAKIEGGYLDIFEPFAFDSAYFPKKFKSTKEGGQWVKLGRKDGMITDDVLEAEILRIPAGNLKPLQSQIWFNKVCKYIIMYGPPDLGSPVLNTTIIISKENYILDGHHRWAQAMLGDPSMKMKVLAVPLDITTLLLVGKTYGTAIGNTPNL